MSTESRGAGEGGWAARGARCRQVLEAGGEDGQRIVNPGADLRMMAGHP